MAIGPDYSVRPYADKYARDETPVSESDLRSIQKMADNVDSKKWGIDTRYSISSSMRLMDEVIKDTLGRQDNVENQFQDVLDETTGKDVINGPEIIAARDGEVNLKARLDKEKQEVTAQLAQVMHLVDEPSGGNDDAIIQQALDVGGHIKLARDKTYLLDSVAITNPTIIEFNGSTFERHSPAESSMLIVSESLTLVGGVIDGKNKGSSYTHLVTFDNPNADLTIKDMVFKNNCLGYPSPILLQESDLVYINRARHVLSDNSTYNLTSRQGISLTNKCKTFRVTNSKFEDCYLYGIDVEMNPNTILVKSDMVDEITLYNNEFINCGAKGEDNRVHNSPGGPFAIHYPDKPDMNIVKKITIDNNVVESLDFLNVTPTFGEPYILITQYETLNFLNNTFDNIDRFTIGVNEHNAKMTVLNGNSFYKENTVGGMGNHLYLRASGVKHVKNNNIDKLYFVGTEQEYIRGNYYRNIGKDPYHYVDEIGKYRIKNKVINGDFSNGLTSWNIASVIPDKVAIDGELQYTGDGLVTAGPSRWVSQENAFESTDKYYVSLFARKLNDEGGLNVEIGYGLNPLARLPLTSKRQRLSSVFNPTDLTNYNSDLTIGLSTGSKVAISNVFVINLTKVFGDGKEPTKEELDIVFNAHPFNLFN